MKIAINPGHTLDGQPGSGAVGIKSESLENRKVGDLVISMLKKLGHTVVDCRVDKASSQSAYLKKCVNIANESKADMFVSIHFNALNTSAKGSEVYIYSDRSKVKTSAQNILNEIVKLGFISRGVKSNDGLYVLSNTNMPALLIECCFIDNKTDMSIYNHEAMAKAIVKGITGKLPS